jgi:Glycosyl hydrolases family 38 N-terminal domain/Alpha mannosidase middle domain
MDPSKRARVTLVPHTHWDREWYAPFDEFRERLLRMIDTLIDAADRGFPHFHLDGQTAMIDDYLAVRPERETDIRRLAGEGKLSLGPWVTQMDEFLVSGESHIRNLERGLARARELGPPLEVGYLPDQFGHIGQMPQILRSAGIDRAVVWRGVPAAIDKDAFVWESPDGSRVLAEYLAFGYFNGQAYDRLDDPSELAEALEKTVERQRPFMAGDGMLVLVGYDHAGPDPGLPARLAAAEPHLRSVTAAIGGLEAHLEARSASDDVPLWRGELRSSARAHLLPNVVSARAGQKSERGRVENLLERYAEPLAALVPDFGWPQAALDHAWLLLLWNGAHDSACGCSHDQVARDVDARFAEARTVAADVASAALSSLSAQVAGAGTLRFNPSPFVRDGVPALGWRVDRDVPHLDAEPVRLDVRGAVLTVDGMELELRDEPDVGDLYNFCYAERGQAPTPPDRIAVERGGALASWDGLDVRLHVERRGDDAFHRIDADIDNRRPDHRLRLHLTLPEPAAGSVAGSPFELVARDLHSEGSDLEAASATWPARGLVLAGGLAVFSEGVVEYEILERRTLALTLLRCVGAISRPDLPTRPFDAGPHVPTPGAQMLGRTRISLGLWRSTRAIDALHEWERFALPLMHAPAAGGGRLPATGTLLDVGGDAALSSVRRRGERLEVRLWNPRADASATAIVGGRLVELSPAQILTVDLG